MAHRHRPPTQPTRPHHQLPRPTPHRRKLQTRRHPMPQALPRPRALPRHPSHHRHDPTTIQDRRLTPRGASDLSGSVQEPDGEEVILGLVRDVDLLEHDRLGPRAPNDEALMRVTLQQIDRLPGGPAIELSTRALAAALHARVAHDQMPPFWQVRRPYGGASRGWMHA